MAEKKQGFLARLFNRLAGRDSFELSVGSVAAKLVEANISRAGGSDLRLSARRIEPDALMAELGPLGPATLAVFFRDADPPDLIFIAPDSSLAALAGSAPNPAASGSAAAAAKASPAARGGMPPLALTVSENLSDFLHLTPGSPPCPSSHRYFKKYAPRDAEELSWKASACVSYKLFPGDDEEKPGPRLYACVEQGIASRIEESLASDQAYQKEVRALVASRKEPSAPAAEAAASEVKLMAPREFVVGNLFLPPRVPCGKQVLESRLESVCLAVDRKSAGEAAGNWVLTSCELGPRKWPVWYFFPAAEAGTPALSRDTVKGMASCILRESLTALSATLGARADKPQIAMDSRPNLAGQSGLLVLKGRVGVGQSFFPCHIFVDYALLSTLLKTFMDPAEIATAPRGPFAALPLLFSLNQSLFRRSIGSFHLALVGAPAREEPFPFAVFMDLIPEHDCAIVLQNYALQTVGARGLRRLFGYLEKGQTPDGKAVARLVTPHSFDEARLLSFLPQKAREDWSHAEREVAGSRPEYNRANAELLEGIHRAIKKRSLLVSPRTLAVLDRMVMPAVRARAKDELARIAASKIPFDTIRKLPKAQVQQFFGLQANRALCLSLLGAEDELAFINANVSRKRFSQLSEDLEFARRQYRDGTIETDDVLRAKREMESAARKLIEDLARQAARERSRKTGGGDGGERARYKGWARSKPRPERG